MVRLRVEGLFLDVRLIYFVIWIHVFLIKPQKVCMYPSQVTIREIANSLPAWVLFTALFIMLSACRSSVSVNADLIRPSDPNATKETRALYRNLHQLSATHVLLGHQECFPYHLHKQ